MSDDNITTVRAKFSCIGMAQDGWSNTVNFTAVTGGSEENDDFNDATPSGTLSIQIHGDVPASDFFEIGKAYFLDFSPVPEQ